MSKFAAGANPARVLRVLPFAILFSALAWYAGLVILYHTNGALGTDPATYVAMALDLAARGTVTHKFPLFNELSASGLSWDAFITPGYHIVTATGIVAPNFALGLPLWLAVAYRLGGAGAIYWATPVLGSFSLIATYALSNELLRDTSAWKRRTISALAVLLLATTPKQIQLALVPMSDVPTQLFCVLALIFAHRVRRPSPSKVAWVWAGLSGLALGMAFLMRHSAMVIVLPLALVAAQWAETRAGRVTLWAVALAFFAVTVAPDFIYRASVLGSPLAIESAESTRVILSDAPRQFFLMLVALFSFTGLGPALLLGIVGFWSLVRRGGKRVAWVLGTWITLFMLLHAPLALTGVFENNLRYLVPTYPALALVSAVGAVRLIEDGFRNQVVFAKVGLGINLVSNSAAPALGALVSLALILLAIRAIAGPERFVARAYGWMSETARADMDALAQQLEPNAVVGVSDQMAGAASLYFRRDVFRPSSMRGAETEFGAFRDMMRSEGRAIYLLGDWACNPQAGVSEQLPVWLASFAVKGPLGEVRDLPYECAQKLRLVVPQ